MFKSSKKYFFSKNLIGQFTSDPSNRLETNCDGELVPQRRERYVFRPMLIKILEAYFLESPFPDSPKRLEIAQACNQSLQLEKKGKILGFGSKL